MSTLDTAPFFSDAFDVSAWVLDQVGPLPREAVLEQLRNDIARYQGELKALLVATVNKDYASFVQLSARIESFQEVINRFKVPLLHVHDRLRAVHIALEDKLRVVSGLLHTRDQVRESKQILSDFVRSHELIARIDRVLKQTEAGAADGDADTTASRLMRLANWFAELDRAVAARPDLPFFVVVRPNIKVRAGAGAGRGGGPHPRPPAVSATPACSSLPQRAAPPCTRPHSHHSTGVTVECPRRRPAHSSAPAFAPCSCNSCTR